MAKVPPLVTGAFFPNQGLSLCPLWCSVTPSISSLACCYGSLAGGSLSCIDKWISMPSPSESEGLTGATVLGNWRTNVDAKVELDVGPLC